MSRAEELEYTKGFIFAVYDDSFASAEDFKQYVVDQMYDQLGEDAEELVNQAIAEIQEAIEEARAAAEAQALAAIKEEEQSKAHRLPSRFWEGEPAEGDDYPVAQENIYGDEEPPFI